MFIIVQMCTVQFVPAPGNAVWTCKWKWNVNYEKNRTSLLICGEWSRVRSCVLKSKTKQITTNEKHKPKWANLSGKNGSGTGNNQISIEIENWWVHWVLEIMKSYGWMRDDVGVLLCDFLIISYPMHFLCFSILAVCISWKFYFEIASISKNWQKLPLKYEDYQSIRSINSQFSIFNCSKRIPITTLLFQEIGKMIGKPQISIPNSKCKYKYKWQINLPK